MNNIYSHSRMGHYFFSYLLTWEVDHTGYIEVIMQGKCGRNIETTFDIKWVIGIYGNWKSQNPGAILELPAK